MYLCACVCVLVYPLKLYSSGHQSVLIVLDHCRKFRIYRKVSKDRLAILLPPTDNHC